ncbi:MAG: hypothetical protein RIR26_2486 [Pseudomonadota bacterium]
MIQKANNKEMNKKEIQHKKMFISLKDRIPLLLVALSASESSLYAQNTSSAPASPPTESSSSFTTEGETITKTTRKTTTARQRSKVSDYGTSLILSPEIGAFSGLPSLKLEKFGPKFGLALEGKALGSVLLRNFLIDAGFGWYFFNIKGFEPYRNIDGSIKTDSSGQALTENMNIKLSGALFEIGTSYRFGPSFFAGTVAQLRYPADLSYQSNVVRSQLSALMGGQVGYQIFDDDFNTRFVLRMLSTINDKDWLGISTTAGLQLGLPFIQPKILTIQETTTKIKERRIVEYKKRDFRIRVTQDVIKIILDNTITFIPDSEHAVLTIEAQKFLIHFASALNDSAQDWGTLRIDSLSREHMNRIRETLVSAGLPPQKVKGGAPVKGEVASDIPVEFSFYGIKEVGPFSEVIRAAMKAQSVPETCIGTQCE